MLLPGTGMAIESEWLQAMVTPALSTSTSTAPGLSLLVGVPARLPDRRRMMLWHVGPGPLAALAGVEGAVSRLAAAVTALGAAVVVAACTRGKAVSAASTATAISKREARREDDADDEREGGDKDGMAVQAWASKCA